MRLHPFPVSTVKPVILSIAALTGLFGWGLISNEVRVSQAQIPPITPSGLTTQVNLSATPPAGEVQYDITGGTRPGGGVNLFHSFGEFNVPNNNIANFLNETALPTSNILSRVTGGNISNIFGTIQTTGFGNANLFLMNPSGFLFGPNATVNVGGMITFTSADYMKLADGARFNAISNAVAEALLTASPVATFGFLGSNPGAITVQGSRFTVTEGTGISLVGGNIAVQSGVLDDGISIQPSRLTAPSGQIKLTSVTSPGEILSSNLQFGANVNGESFTSLGSITISQDTHIDTAGGTSGTITIRGGQLTISDGATITSAPSSSFSASAGSVTIKGTDVQLTGSDVVINGTNVSVTGSKVTAANLDGSGGTIAITAGSADHPGNVTVAQNASLDASGTKGGSISIRGKQLVVDNATISADTGDADGAPIAIDINVTGDVSVTAVDVPALTARTTDSGNAGEIRISSGNMDVTATTLDNFLFSVIDAHTSGPGKAGNVIITTNGLAITGDPVGLALFIDSGTTGQGHGGDVTTSAQSVQMQNTFISTGNFVANIFGEDATGAAGNVEISADSLHLASSGIDTNSFSFKNNTGRAGDISVTARDIQLETSQFNAQGLERGGAITVNADRVLLTDSRFETQTILTPGGGIVILAKTVDLTQGSQLISVTGGAGDSGSINVSASEHFGILEGSRLVRPSGIFTQSFGSLGSLGDAGDVFITTPQLQMTAGGRINTVTKSSGRGGNVTINAIDSVSISGEFPDDISEPLFNLGPVHQSGIFTSTVGGKCVGACGDAGRISITTGSIIMGSGSQIDSGTSSTGQGGNITIHATDTSSLAGTLSDGTPVGIFSRTIGTDPQSGDGGNITLTAGQSVAISDGASVSASSDGPSNAGDIAIDAGQRFDMQRSSITTQATQASGGNIDIRAVDRVRLVNSVVSSSVQGGASTAGGNIAIDPNVIVLQNSDITAKAVQGAGGNITLTTPLFLRDSSSQVDASSQFGVNGTVTIQSPTSNVSGSLGPLASKPSQAQALLTQRCAALVNGQASSFVVAGREQLPADPGGWLSSPFAFAALGESLDGDNAVASIPTVMAIAADDTSTVSLRRLTPAGFLMANFAGSEATGCRS